MKRKLYNVIVFFFLVASISAQKTDKKYTEKFYTNNDVEIEINASNADIEVQNWNKNEVLVEATIEVEGVSKKEAQKYIEKWKFEALGNKSKVRINANSNLHSNFGLGQDFVLFNSNGQDFPNVYQLQSIDNLIKFPNMDEIAVPGIDFDNILKDIDFDVNEMFERGEISKFKWKEGKHNYTIKSLKEWKKFKKTDAYQDYLKNNSEAKTKIFLKKNKGKVIDKEELKKELAKAKEGFKKINKKEIKEALAKAQEQLKKTDFSYYFLSNDNNLSVDGKKVKIKKKITIKAPKNATFNLNTRHCKVKLPNAKVSGKVSYGTFNADGLVGGSLDIHSSPVDINTLTACTLFLNNVQTANVSLMNNATLKSSSTDVSIDEILKNVTIDNSFGKLYVAKFNKNFEQANINLSQTDAYLTFGNDKPQFTIDILEKLKGSWNSDAMKINKNSTKVFGNFTVKSKKNASDTFSLTGKYSKLTIN